VLVPAETAQAGTIGQVSEGFTWQRDPIAVRSTCQLASRLISKKPGGFAPRRNIRRRWLIRSVFDSEVDEEHPEIDFKELFERSTDAQKM